MAISPMQKVTVITLQSQLRELLKTIQQLEQVQLENLTVIDEWQQPASEGTELPSLQDEQERVHQLGQRQERIKKAIAQYQEFLPKPTAWQQLTKPKPTISFDLLQRHGEEFNERLAVERVGHLTTRYQQLEAEKQTLLGQRETLHKWQKLDVLPQRETDLIQRVIGTVPSDKLDRYYKALIADERFIVQRIYSNALEVGVLVFSKEVETQDLVTLLAPYQFTVVDLPLSEPPISAVPKTEARLQEIDNTILAILQELKNSHAIVEQLQWQLDYLASLQVREQARLFAGQTENLAALEGWIEQEHVATFQQLLTTKFQGLAVVRTRDVVEQEIDRVPIKLINSALVAPFETVTRMYALPKYNELDPTPYLMPFYLTFFGMMVADLGYGILIGAVTLVGMLLLKHNRKLQPTLKFYFWLGLSTSVWGAIYGSFFGYNLPFKLIDTTKDVTTVLGLSVGFGFIQILVGLLLNTYQKAKRREMAEAYTSGLAWILILLGLAGLAAGSLLSNMAIVAEIGKWVAIVNAVGILVASVAKAKGIGGLGSGLYNLYGVSGYIGDLVSYTRLMALGLSGGSIGAAFNLIIAFLPPLARFSVGIVLFIVLHAINIFLSMLSGYVHGARLMFVEFFGKFYEGGGKPFEPLAPVNEYVTTTKQKMEE